MSDVGCKQGGQAVAATPCLGAFQRHLVSHCWKQDAGFDWSVARSCRVLLLSLCSLLQVLSGMLFANSMGSYWMATLLVANDTAPPLVCTSPTFKHSIRSSYLTELNCVTSHTCPDVVFESATTCCSAWNKEDSHSTGLYLAKEGRTCILIWFRAQSYPVLI